MVVMRVGQDDGFEVLREGIEQGSGRPTFHARMHPRIEQDGAGARLEKVRICPDFRGAGQVG